MASTELLPPRGQPVGNRKSNIASQMRQETHSKNSNIYIYIILLWSIVYCIQTGNADSQKETIFEFFAQRHLGPFFGCIPVLGHLRVILGLKGTVSREKFSN